MTCDLTKDVKLTSYPEAQAHFSAWRDLLNRSDTGDLVVKNEGLTIQVSTVLKFGAITTTKITEIALRRINLVEHTFKRYNDYGGAGWQCENCYKLTVLGTDTKGFDRILTIALEETHSGGPLKSWSLTVSCRQNQELTIKRPRSPASE